MDDAVIRLWEVELKHFQNVEYGKITFEGNAKRKSQEMGSDILGIYGQNGSGKTAFLHALSILSALLSGKRLAKDTANYIMVGETVSSLVFVLSVISSDSSYKVIYEVDLCYGNVTSNIQAKLSRERLKYSELRENKWSVVQTIVDCDYSGEEIFTPKKKLTEITKNKKNILVDFLISKKYAVKQATSFIFSKETVSLFLEHCQNKVYNDLLSGIAHYGEFNLYIIDNRNSGLISAQIALPFSFKLEENGVMTMGSVALQLDGPSTVSKQVFVLVGKIIDTMNTVLVQIIPGLTIGLKDLGKQLMPDGGEGHTAVLVSVRNHLEIPLKYESEGIIKIISILHMLISVYNNPSMTLAVDEIDSGVFEYLLGEIIKVLEDSGRGQLIFTSHNLRLLERLDKESIVFTTTNPKNRYMRLSNGKSNHNLRDLYYHDIVLGGQKECLYHETNPFSIGRAFRMAGEDNGF